VSAFFHIVYEVVAPIFLMIGAGYLAQKKVGFDSRTLVRLNFWIFVPAFLFSRIVGSTLSGGQMLLILVHFVLLFALMGVLAWYSAALIGAGRPAQRALLVGAVLQFGYYGVPVAQLAFGGAGEAVQAVTIMLQNMSNFTVGLGLAAGGAAGGGATRSKPCCDCR
jgi:predicted permease